MAVILLFLRDLAELVGRREPESRIRAQPLACTRAPIPAFTVQSEASILVSMGDLKQRFAQSRESNRSAA